MPRSFSGAPIYEARATAAPPVPHEISFKRHCCWLVFCVPVSDLGEHKTAAARARRVRVLPSLPPSSLVVLFTGSLNTTTHPPPCLLRPRNTHGTPLTHTRHEKKWQVLRLDLQHEETHGGRPRPGPPSPIPAPESPQSLTDSFRRLYDTFLLLALAFSVLEALMFRLGRRRIAANAERWRRSRGIGGGGGGGGGFLSTGALESLLDEEDVKRAGWEDWRGETVEQVGWGVWAWVHLVVVVLVLLVLCVCVSVWVWVWVRV